jgi:hypothetical protein
MSPSITPTAISVVVGPDVVLGEDRLEHVDPLGAGPVATVIAVVVIAMVVLMGVRVIVVFVSVHGAVVVPMKSTHRPCLSRDIQ